MSFVRFVSAVPVEDMCTMKQFWSVFPDGILENFTGVRSMLETFLGQRICSLVCYTAVFSGEERCVTTLKTAV